MYGALRRGEEASVPPSDATEHGDKSAAADHGRAGARIRTLRRARGWTQEELARATGVSRSAVAQWETGRAGFNAKIRVIAHALDVSLRELQPGERVELGALARDQRQPSNDEAMLLRLFRELGRDDQACMLRLVRRLASVIDD
jgi:transcriptional regulator with XRE-family HTH domain